MIFFFYKMGNVGSRNFGDPNLNDYCNNFNNFFTDTCRTHCMSPFNPNCEQQVINNCFDIVPDGDNVTSPIFYDRTCRNWVIEKVSKGGSAAIDEKIREICSSFLIDPSNYKNDLDTQKLCSCYFDDSIYENYYRSLLEKVPTLKPTLGSGKCLFPGCSTSPFKPVDILGENKCPTVQCIQGVNLTTEGKITGNVTVIQDPNCLQVSIGRSCVIDSDCTTGLKCNRQLCSKTCVIDSDCPTGYFCDISNNNFCKKLISPTPSPTPTPSSEQNTKLFIGIGVGVIVLIIFVVLLVIGLGSSKGQKQNK